MPKVAVCLVLALTLTACTLQARVEGSPEASPRSEITRLGAISPATASPTPTAALTATPRVEQDTPSATLAATVLPTQSVPRASATPGVPPTLPPGVTPTARIPAVIHLFHVSPFQDVEPGDPLTVVWEAEGNDARICQISANGPTDCVDVPLRGERQFTALDTDRPYWLVLYVNVQTFPDAEQIEVANVFVGCEHDWFFDQPEVAVCPRTPPITGQFAAQQFEQGWMLYLADPGVYYGLADLPLGPGAYERTLLRVFDPLNILGDTSSQVTPPAGRVAPASGFGHVWRGDAETYYDWRGLLGWGLAPEFNYTGTYQCDQSVSRWQFCYVRHPDGWLAVLHPNVNWYPKSVGYVP